MEDAPIPSADGAYHRFVFVNGGRARLQDSPQSSAGARRRSRDQDDKIVAPIDRVTTGLGADQAVDVDFRRAAASVRDALTAQNEGPGTVPSIDITPGKMAKRRCWSRAVTHACDRATGGVDGHADGSSRYTKV